MVVLKSSEYTSSRNVDDTFTSTGTMSGLEKLKPIKHDLKLPPLVSCAEEAIFTTTEIQHTFHIDSNNSAAY